MLKKGEHTYGSIDITSRRKGRDVTIGKYCSIGNGVVAITDGHYTTNFTTYPMGHTESTIEYKKMNEHRLKGNIDIGNDVWIGERSVLIYGTKIGDGAVIGAYSVVRGRVKPYSVVIGNPAQFLYYRFSREVINMLLDLKWWDLHDDTVKHYSDILISNDIEKLKKFYKKIKGNL